MEDDSQTKTRGIWPWTLNGIQQDTPYGPSVFLREIRRLQVIEEERLREEARLKAAENARRVEEEARQAERDRAKPKTTASAVDVAFALLGIERNATRNQIQKAAWKLAWKHHPDRGGDAEQFKKVMAARDTCYIYASD